MLGTLPAPECAKCGSPMVAVETVAVLASVQDHSIYQCVWCAHVLLIEERFPCAGSAHWLMSAPTESRCDVTWSFRLAAEGRSAPDPA